jgi:predicted nucleotidyltransferase
MRSRTNIDDIKRELGELKREHYKHNKIRDLDDMRSKRKRKINKLSKALKSKSDRFSVTDHAVLRYVQRCMGIDIDMIRESIRKKAIDYFDTFGNGVFPLSESVRMVIKGGHVVTIITKDSDLENDIELGKVEDDRVQIN